MRRTKPRVRSTPKVRRNAQGAPRERFEGLRDEDYREWIRNLPCILTGREGHQCWHPEKRSDAAHVESKACGSGDAGNLFPACRRAHQDQHDHGMKSFCREWGVNVREIAGALWLTYEQEKGAPVL